MEVNNKESIIKKIEGIAEPAATEMGLSLVDVEYLQDGGYWYVRVYVEKMDGDITLEDCATLSGKIDEAVDKLIEQRFFLEVSSPGIERPLKKPADYIRFKGEKVKLSLKHKVNDNKNFEGVIADFKENTVFLEINENEIMEIPLSEVRKANLVYEFEEF